MMSATRGQGFGPEVKRRIMLGTYALSAGYYDAYYGQAQKVRTLIIRDYERAFADFDVLVSPTSPTTAFRIGEQRRRPAGDVPVGRLHDPGQPRRACPRSACRAAWTQRGLPVGLQLTAPVLGEPVLFRAAQALEGDLGLDLRPPILAGV